MPRDTDSPPMTAPSNEAVQERLRNAEAAIETLRVTISGIEREVGIIRADLERLRVEAERAAGAKLR